MLTPLLVSSLVAHAGPCTMVGTPTDWRVTVAPEGSAPFDVLLSDSTVRVEIGPGARDVYVEAPLALEASIPALAVALTREAWLSDVLFATSQTRLVPTAIHGAEAELRVDLGGVGIDPVVLPCDALVFGDLEPRISMTSPMSKHATVPLRKRPDRGPDYTLDLANADEIAAFDLGGRRRGWVRIQRRWWDGTIVRGWIPADRLDLPWSWMTKREGGGRRCGYATAERLVLRSGATVHTTPGGPVWATAARDVAVELFRTTWGERDPAENGTWVRLEQIAGIAEPPDGCAPLASAWVRSEAVTPSP